MMLYTFLICSALSQLPCTAETALRRYQCAPLGSELSIGIDGWSVHDDCPRPEEVSSIVVFYGLPADGHYRLVYERDHIATN